MALTQSQKDQLLQLKAQGFTKEQAFARVFRGSPLTTAGRDSVGEDLLSAGRGLGSDFMQRAQNIREGFAAGARGEQTPFETGAQMAGNILGGTGDITFRATQAAVTPFMSGQQEKAVTDTAQKVFAPVGEAISKTSERTQRNISGGLGFLESLPGAKFLTQPLSNLRRGGVRTILGGATESVTPSSAVVTKTPEQIFDDVGKQFRQIAQDSNLSPRAQQEAAEAALNWKEKYIGLTPDVKSRLGKMGEEKITEYIDAAYRRNIDDTAPTPYEVGAQNVNTALEQLDKALRTTGSEIGQARQKLATIKAPITSVNKVENVFKSELDKLNLTVKNGEIVQKPGMVSKTDSASDVRVLQSLYNDLLTFKQSPTLKNAIDLRMAFDGKIKFGKSARDVSNSVDPVSRSVRKALAEESARVVGKSNAAELQRYSDFMEAYGDLKSFTDRAAGGEYLLRLVLSGRGGEARKLIDTVREYTGKDLMDDATAMKVATQMFSNENAQNLFKQEVTRAGYDAAAVLSGSPTGVLQVVGKRLLDYGIDPETVIKAAAAGTSGYLIMTYVDDDGMIAPAGLAILSAMPNQARKEAIEQATDIAKSVGKKTDELKKYIDTPPELGKAQSVTTKTTDLPNTQYKNKELNFVYNTKKADFGDQDFAQDIEPAGRYMNVGFDEFPGGNGMVKGTVTFKNPLVIDWKTSRTGGWKTKLSERYSGKTGKELSQAIIDDGYDGIIAVSDDVPREAVNLQTFRGTTDLLEEARKFDKESIMSLPIEEADKTDFIRLVEETNTPEKLVGDLIEIDKLSGRTTDDLMEMGRITSTARNKVVEIYNILDAVPELRPFVPKQTIQAIRMAGYDPTQIGL